MDDQADDEPHQLERLGNVREWLAERPLRGPSPVERGEPGADENG